MVRRATRPKIFGAGAETGPKRTRSRTETLS